MRWGSGRRQFCWRNTASQRLNVEDTQAGTGHSQCSCCRDMRCSRRDSTSLEFILLKRFWRQEHKFPIPGQMDSTHALDLRRLAEFTLLYNGKRAANAKLQWVAGTAMIGVSYADSCLISQFHTQNKFRICSDISGNKLIFLQFTAWNLVLAQWKRKEIFSQLQYPKIPL